MLKVNKRPVIHQYNVIQFLKNVLKSKKYFVLTIKKVKKARIILNKMIWYIYLNLEF